MSDESPASPTTKSLTILCVLIIVGAAGSHGSGSNFIIASIKTRKKGITYCAETEK
ncbi:MAG: hypothetical protein FWC50_06920 [Planctomycetaceae bacterium]|nr:hypothetical protein [Planctomycetaceae bacterium]